MAIYQLMASSTTIRRTTDNALIPPDPANKDYAAYQAWVAAGNTPDPAPIPTLQQQAIAAITQPVTLICTTTTGLNGQYSIEQAKRLQINTIATSINSKFGIPGTGNTFSWADTSGVIHDWPQKEFLWYAQAVRDYIYALDEVVHGRRTTLPTSTLTITAQGPAPQIMLESAQSLTLSQANDAAAQGRTNDAVIAILQYLGGSSAL